VSKDGLPDGPAQPRGRKRTADDVAKGDVEGALDLPEAREGVAWIVFEGKAQSFDQKCRSRRETRCKGLHALGPQFDAEAGLN
jgi:hypothetical protein